MSSVLKEPTEDCKLESMISNNRQIFYYSIYSYLAANTILHKTDNLSDQFNQRVLTNIPKWIHVIYKP